MSNALAIATVTQALVNKVTASLSGSLVSVPVVSTLRPDDSSLQGAETTPRVNIFLYQVTPNLAFRNADLPTRRSNDSLIRRPQLALDLHYLVSFYGSDTTLEHQRLLGAAARYLHAYPVVERADVQTVQGMTDPVSNTRYLASDLSEQSELIRFTPMNFSLEDMSKLWAAFPQTDFVLSVAYMASVVLIETDDIPPGPALPVLTWNLQAVPFGMTSIDSVNPQSLALTMSPLASIDLIGQGLAADNTAKFMTPGDDDPIFASVGPGGSGQTVTVMLPTGLRPGVNSVQLVQTVASPPGSPPSSSVLSSSNSMTFVIVPTVQSLTPNTPPGSIRAVIYPSVGIDQQVSLVLNQLGGPLRFVLPAQPRTADTDTLLFNTAFADSAAAGGTSTVPAGTYLARVAVDSAQSRLTVGGSGTFNGPTVTL